MKFISRLIVACACAILTSYAASQTFPSKPIKIVVPLAPGGAMDALIRAIAQELSSSLGQAVYVENHPGAGGAIGSRLVAYAPADGYTLLAGNNGTHIINPLVEKNLPYNPERDFRPISLIQQSPMVIAINPKLGIGSLTDLVKYARSKPDGITFASPNTGHSLVVMYFAQQAGIQLRIVPYKGSGPAITDVIAGHVDAIMDTPVGIMPSAEAGQLRVLASTLEVRPEKLNNIPTVSENYPGFNVPANIALFAPKSTPDFIVHRLHEVIEKAIATRNVQDVITRSLGVSINGGPEDVRNWMNTNRTMWQQVILKSGFSIN